MPTDTYNLPIEPKRFPLGIRLLLSLGFMFFAFLVTGVISFFLRITGDVGAIFSLSSLVFAAVLPHLNYPQRYLALGAPFTILTVWFIVLSFILPTLVKPYDIAKAERMIPEHTTLNPSQVVFNPGEAFDYDPSVTFQYHSNNPQDDYIKLIDFYKEQLGKKGWKVEARDEYNNIDPSYVTFSKFGADFGISGTSFISVGFNEEAEYPLYVVVNF